MSVNVRQVRAEAITSGGPTQDFTVAGFGTPKAAIIIVNLATVNGVSADGAALSFGIVSNNVADGLKQYAVAIRADDALADMNLCHRTSNTKCVCLLGVANTVDAEATAAFIVDGVRLTWTDFPAAAVFVTCILFTGTDLSTHAGDFLASTSNNTETIISTPNFSVDQVLMLGSFNTSFDTTQSLTGVSTTVGIALGVSDRGAPVLQCGLAYAGIDAFASSAASDVANNAWAIDDARNSADWKAIDVTNYTAVGFSAITRGSGGVAFYYPYLALGFTGKCNHWNGIIDSPTATGSWSVTNPGFKPQFVLALTCGVSNLTTSATRSVMIQSTTGAGTFGISAFTANETFSNSIGDDDAAATSDTESWSTNTFTARNDTKANLCDGTFVSFDTLGFTLSITAIPPTTRKWPTLVIGEFVAGGGTEHFVQATAQIILSIVPTPSIQHAGIATANMALNSAALAGVLIKATSTINVQLNCVAAASLLLSPGSVSCNLALGMTANAVVVHGVSAIASMALEAAAVAQATRFVSASADMQVSGAAVATLLQGVTANATMTLSTLASATVTGEGTTHFVQVTMQLVLSSTGAPGVAYSVAASANMSLTTNAALGEKFAGVAQAALTLTASAVASVTRGAQAAPAMSFGMNAIASRTIAAQATVDMQFTSSTSAGQIHSVQATMPIVFATQAESLAGWSSYGTSRTYIANDNLGLSYGFGVYMRASTGQVAARLYNETDGQAVAGSILTADSVDSTDFVQLSSGALVLENNKAYVAQFARISGGNGEVMSAAPVVV